MASSQTQTPIKLLSHNVQGLNYPVKWRKAFNYFHSVGAEILFLQETHFPSSYKPNYIHKHYPTFFPRERSRQKRGVAICVARSLAFLPSQIISDPDGRFLLVKGDLEGSLVTFLAYYAPNKVQLPFFQNLFQQLCHLFEGMLLIGGNSNIPLDSPLDKTHHLGSQILKPSQMSTKFAKLLHENDLVDIWRELNVTAHDYTFYSHVHLMHLRIDHIFA